MQKSSKENSEISVVREENNTYGSSFLGPGIRLEGEIQGQADLTVRGYFKGKIQLEQNSLVIEENGHVQADIQASTVIIKGKVTGNILASEKVTITKTGSAAGEITASRISIEDGAQFKGNVKMGIKKQGLDPSAPLGQK